MKAPLFLPDDSPLLVLFFDPFERVHALSRCGVAEVWFDCEIVAVSTLEAAVPHIANPERTPDLLLLTPESWNRGGAELVRLARRRASLAALPIYWINFCRSQPESFLDDCTEPTLRLSDSCEKYFGASTAFAHLIQPGDPARIDGVLCPATLRERFDEIVGRIADHWEEVSRTNSTSSS